MGGAGLCCLRIHQSLLEQGIESKVVTLCNTQNVKEEYEYGRLQNFFSKLFSKLLRIFGLTITERNQVMKLCGQNGATYSLPCSSIDLSSCKWIEWADVVHLHWVNNYLDYSSFFKKVEKPIVWTLHDENFFFGVAHYSNTVIADNPLEIKYSKIKQDILYRVKKLSVVLLSEYFYNKFKNHSLLKGRHVKVINNAIDVNKFKPIDMKDARKRLGLSPDDILIGFTASIITDKRKGLDVLRQTVEKLANPRLKILAIGSNPEQASYPNVISIGAQKGSEAISVALSAANFFAMPSYQEAFAQSPMEAMACGLPVVVFPVSGTSELVNESNGVICDDFTLEALKKGIETVMNRNYAPETIRQYVINRFSPETIISDYIDIYKESLDTDC